MAVKCLGSLLAMAARPLRLVLHDDGTLDASARERLTDQLGPTCEIMDRHEASERVGESLRGYPRCSRFRNEHLFGPKLFDVPLLSRGRTVYCDADILWTRPCDCPAYFEGSSTAFVVMRDLKESYAVSFNRWPLLRRYGIRLASRVCAGLISFDLGAYDLDHVEWLLGLDEQFDLFGGFRFWAEQTIYAALAARAGCSWVDPRECLVAHRSHFARTRRAAIIHFAGFSRPLLDGRYRELDFKTLPASADSLGTVPAPDCGLGRRLLSAFRMRTVLREPAR